MSTISLTEAHTRLPDLIHQLGPGEEITITEGDQIVARLIGAKSAKPRRPGPGLCRAMFGPLPSADDEEHLQAFAEYMP